MSVPAERLEPSGVPSETERPPLCAYCQTELTMGDYGPAFGYEHLHQSCRKEIEAAKRAAGSLPREAGAPDVKPLTKQDREAILFQLHAKPPLPSGPTAVAIERYEATVRLLESRASLSPGGAPPPREIMPNVARGLLAEIATMPDQARLTALIAEARTALSTIPVPLPHADNPLYYPLLFLVEACEAEQRWLNDDAARTR